MKALSIKEIVAAVSGTLLAGDENTMITSVSTNSKELEKGALFVPIIGERVDAHDFIDMAMQNGANASFTSKMVETSETNNKSYILVKDTLKALQDLATYYRGLFDIPVIGVTGSVGKTTTKEMIAATLETSFCVLKTAGNMNSQVGLPLTVLRIEDNHEVAVIEMGISQAGEMEKLASIAKPTLAVVTNIGVSHIEMLLTKENIRKEKLNIVDEFNKIHSENVLYLNGDDRLLAEVKASLEDVSVKTKEKLEFCEVVTYGIEDQCNYRAVDVKTKGDQTFFTFLYQGQREVIELNVLGLHNVGNAVAALAIGMKLGIHPSIAKKGLKQYRPIAMRGQIEKHHGMKIIDDTYNASPDSMKSGIKVLLQLEDVKRRFAVLADVLELGELSEQLHYEVGEFIATLNPSIDELVTVGEKAFLIGKAVQDKNNKVRVNSFHTNPEATAYLKSQLREGDAILVKGSRGMHTDEIVNELRNLQ